MAHIPLAGLRAMDGASGLEDARLAARAGQPGHLPGKDAGTAACDALVVCMNSDASVRRLKGPARPLNPAADRAAVLRALDCVDEVVIFDEDTPERLLARLRPGIWVKGGDYDGRELPEAAVLRQWGGMVVTVPYLDGTVHHADRGGRRPLPGVQGASGS
jgi:rfaE bifunctional protein nucleotidyltransferase chain/domain